MADDILQINYSPYSHIFSCLTKLAILLCLKYLGRISFANLCSSKTRKLWPFWKRKKKLICWSPPRWSNMNPKTGQSFHDTINSNKKQPVINCQTIMKLFDVNLKSLGVCLKPKLHHTLRWSTRIFIKSEEKKYCKYAT